MFNNIYKFYGKLLPTNRDTTPIFEIKTLGGNFCFKTSKTVVLFYLINKHCNTINKIII